VIALHEALERLAQDRPGRPRSSRSVSSAGCRSPRSPRASRSRTPPSRATGGSHGPG
jgi:hypothetical protein